MLPSTVVALRHAHRAALHSTTAISTPLHLTRTQARTAHPKRTRPLRFVGLTKASHKVQDRPKATVSTYVTKKR
jgi:hypothetical protein